MAHLNFPWKLSPDFWRGRDLEELAKSTSVCFTLLLAFKNEILVDEFVNQGNNKSLCDAFT